MLRLTPISLALMVIAVGLGQLIPPEEVMPFAYTGYARNSDIYLFNLNRSLLVNLTASPEFEATPAISRDYRRIAFGHDAPEGSGISVMEHPFLESVFLHTPSITGFGLSWSPDGQQLAYVSLGTYNMYSIQMIHLANATTRILLKTGDALLTPSWSPDGLQLAFARRVMSKPAYLYVVDVNCREDCEQHSSVFVNYPMEDILPVWSPDGSQIAFFSSHGLGQGILTLPVDCLESTGGCLDYNPRGLDIRDMVINSLTLQWSKDGQHLFFVGADRRNGIMRQGIFAIAQDCYNAPQGCQATLLFDLSNLRW